VICFHGYFLYEIRVIIDRVPSQTASWIESTRIAAHKNTECEIENMEGARKASAARMRTATQNREIITDRGEDNVVLFTVSGFQCIIDEVFVIDCATR